MKKPTVVKTATYFTIGCLTVTLLAGCNNNDEPAATGSVRLQFSHVVGNQPLRLNSTEYTNAAGEPFRAKMFKYYVSNIRLLRTDGTEFVEPESYHLVDEADANSKTITVADVPAGDYFAVRFVLGVDSVRNFSGAQTGALDPLNGMLWDWNTGYIFVKFEGTAVASPEPDDAIVYHIGGFKNPNNIRTVSPPLNGKLAVAGARITGLNYRVDVAQLFAAPNRIEFAKTPTLMFDPRTAQMADNCANMFLVTSITAAE